MKIEIFTSKESLKLLVDILGRFERGTASVLKECLDMENVKIEDIDGCFYNLYDQLHDRLEEFEMKK